MSSNRKDRILQQIIEHTHHSKIDEIDKHIYELESDGLVNVVRASDGSIITVNASPKTKQFLDCGGYTAIFRSRYKARLWNGIWFIIGAATSAAIQKLADTLIEK